MGKRTKDEGKPKAKKAPEAEAVHRPFAGIAKALAKAKESERQKPKAPPAPARPAKSASPPPRTAPAPVDQGSFALYMAGVRPLNPGTERIPESDNRVERAARGALPKEDLDAEAREQLRSFVAEGYRFEVVDDSAYLEGRRLDVDRRDLRRLRRAQYAVDGKLDLHGLSIEEARRAVEAYVKKRASEGDRMVVLVHGKGTHSPRGQGGSRGEIAAWLAQSSASRHVAAFCPAPPELGGTGAVLVLLAR